MSLRLDLAQKLIDQVIAIESANMPVEDEAQIGLVLDQPIKKLSELDSAVQNFVAVFSKARLYENFVPIYYENGSDRFMIHYTKQQGVIWYERVRSRIAKEDQIVCTRGAHKAKKIVDQILGIE